MKVTIISYHELPDKEKKYQQKYQPNNGRGKEESNYLKVEIPNEPVLYYSDAMEVEDATFTRDLSWIKNALIMAYKAGEKNSLKGEQN